MNGGKGRRVITSFKGTAQKRGASEQSREAKQKLYNKLYPKKS